MKAPTLIVFRMSAIRAALLLRLSSHSTKYILYFLVKIKLCCYSNVISMLVSVDFIGVRVVIS